MSIVVVSALKGSPNLYGDSYNPLPSVWGKTLIFPWLYPHKFVNLSESDGRAIIGTPRGKRGRFGKSLKVHSHKPYP
jgi:hypothetical protein